MAYNVIMQKVKALGFCCQFDTASRRRTLPPLRSHMNSVSTSALPALESKVRDGKITARCG